MPWSFRRSAAYPVALIVSVTLLGCEKPPPLQKDAPPAPVTVTTAAKRTVPIQVRAIGTVKVIATVSVRPRVGGELTEVHFKEGDYVAKGRKLFTIDPRPYEAAVQQAKATLTKNEAALLGAQRNLDRLERVGTSGTATAEVDTAQTAVDTAKAAVAADQAALHSAQLQAMFTTITSPLDGRTGGLLVTAGNLVAANDANPLVVINQVSPIYVAFAVPEQDLPAITAAQKLKPLAVAADPHDGKDPAQGTLAFVDNAVDVTTGTVQLKAEFPNTDRRLWPGQFVDVVMTVGERPHSVVVPTAAVQAGQMGQYVYVITADKTAEVRPVEVAFEAQGEAVIASGLSGGESVVLEGQLRLAPKAKVEVMSKPAEKPVAEAAK